MAEAKQNRLDRELDVRTEWARPDTWRPPETLPQPNDRPGWTHRYVRISMMGQSDPSNISGKLREGYEPVRAEDYPELMVHAITDGRFKGNIEIGGLLLCRIPVEFMKQREAYYAKQNQAQMESVDNNYLRDSNPKMPLFAERKSQVTFGSGT
jgi:hypothetical protein